MEKFDHYEIRQMASWLTPEGGHAHTAEGSEEPPHGSQYLGCYWTLVGHMPDGSEEKICNRADLVEAACLYAKITGHHVHALSSDLRSLPA